MESEYAERYCAYTDILGFRNLINELSPLQIQALLAKVHEPGADSTADEADFRAQSISDAVAISAAATPQGLLTLFSALESLTVELLAEGYLLRGGIVKGKLIHNDRMIFGPALVSAFEMESQVAKFPRIMVRSDVSRDAKSSLGEGYKSYVRNSRDGPRFLHVLRSLEASQHFTENPLHFEEYPANLLPKCRAVLAKRFQQSRDNPQHFEKVNWFIEYWDTFAPRLGLSLAGYNGELAPIMEYRKFPSVIDQDD